jgi:HKD family nuclease
VGIAFKAAHFKVGNCWGIGRKDEEAIFKLHPVARAAAQGPFPGTHSAPSVQFIHGPSKTSAVTGVLNDAKHIVIVSAYTTPSGLAEVTAPIMDCIARDGHVDLFFGIDRTGIASPELVRQLARLLKRAGAALRVILLVESERSFLHAKIFAARKTGCTEILVGSLNLTSSGLSANHEFGARLVGSANSFLKDVIDFINSIEGTTELTLENAERLAAALTRHSPNGEAQVARERRRREASARLLKVLAALKSSAKPVLREDEVNAHLHELLSAGAFWSYQFDLEKLSIPSGLATLYDQGLLPRERTSAAGTARLKAPMSISATFPLVPPDRQKEFSRQSKRLGKALSACGFETPFGFWVPTAYLPRLELSVQEIAEGLPRGDRLDAEVRDFVEQHKRKLSETIEAILSRATKSGIQHPKHWKESRDTELSAIRHRFLRTSLEAWPKSLGHEQAIQYTRKKLLGVVDRLDADLAVAKLQRIRPEIVSVPVNADSHVVRRLLECMIWSVAEDKGRRNNSRPAVRALATRNGIHPTIADLSAVSEALIEQVDGAEQSFFTLLGVPPYWTVATPDVNSEADFDDDD